MNTSKVLSVIFSQDATVIRTPRKDIRRGQGMDVKRSICRGLISDTGREKKQFVSKM